MTTDTAIRVVVYYIVAIAKLAGVRWSRENSRQLLEALRALSGEHAGAAQNGIPLYPPPHMHDPDPLADAAQQARANSWRGEL
jgi:hypothetical protein